MSGAIVSKNSNQLHKQDMIVIGELLAGTAQRPLKRDCYIGISFKDHEAIFAGAQWQAVAQRVGFCGFEVVSRGRIRVHSSDPQKARLVFQCHRQDGAGDTGYLPDPEQEPERWQVYKQIPRRINISIWKNADVLFDGVVFEDVEKGGIMLQEMSMKDTWRNVSFGDNNGGPPEELFVRHEPSMAGRGNYSYNIEKAVTSEESSAVGKGQGVRYPRILPLGGTFATGDYVTLRLEALGDPEMRYTTDGGDPKKGRVYDEPLTLTEPLS